MRDNIPKGLDFEDRCFYLLQGLCFANLQLTKRSNDQGADLVGDLGKTKYGSRNWIAKLDIHIRTTNCRTRVNCIGGRPIEPAGFAAIGQGQLHLHAEKTFSVDRQAHILGHLTEPANARSIGARRPRPGWLGSKKSTRGIAASHPKR